MKTSKYIKVDNNVLIEYIYDDNNNVAENYQTITDKRNGSTQFLSTIPAYKNTLDNQLYTVDPIQNKTTKIDLEKYNFLQLKDYAGSTFVRYDIIRFYFPNNYVFNEFKGFNVNAYVYDYDNSSTITLSNYFFDITNPATSTDMDFISPPLLFQEKLWGKAITIQIPSPYILGLQRDGGVPKQNSINQSLSADGVSLTSPIFLDFSFITKIDIVNGENQYYLDSERTVSFPQVPDFQNLAVMIKHSDAGDFFEIYGIYNSNQAEFVKFMNDSYKLGNRYFIQYVITTFEENIKGKTITFNITENFDEVIEFRPIIKFSTTTAIIDVEMRLIDQVDDSQIMRRASYGMLQDEVAKYSLNLSKINISNAVKPKIYNTRTSLNTENTLLLGKMGGFGGTQLKIETVKVPFPVFIEKNNVVAKSDSVEYGKDLWKGIGKLRLVIYPFDNIVKFVIAKSVTTTNSLTTTSSTANVPTVEYFDLNGAKEVNLVFKNTKNEVVCALYRQGNEVDLTSGVVIFKLAAKDIQTVRTIYQTKVNTFYIVVTNSNNEKTPIYSGTFIMFDDITNVININEQVNSDVKTSIKKDSSIVETAVITQQLDTSNATQTTNNAVQITPFNLSNSTITNTNFLDRINSILSKRTK